MAFVHGSKTVVTVNAVDLTAFTKTSTLENDVDIHDVTGGGATAHAYFAGLLDGTFTMSGTYDGGASGPRATLEPLQGTSTTVIRKPEGTATGKPQQSFTALVKKYTETDPVDGMITWSCDFQISGAITRTTQ